LILTTELVAQYLRGAVRIEQIKESVTT